MSEQEQEQQAEESSEEPEETMKDLEVPDEESANVQGGKGKEKW